MCSHRHQANMKLKYCIRVVLLIAIQIAKVQSLRDGSLTFVIDDTGSMQPVIDQVKAAVVDIMKIVKSSDSPIKNTVLVTFNDPDHPHRTLRYPKYQIRTVTTSTKDLYKSLASINVYGGGDCPEYALTGIGAALNTSYSNSHLFVFTDASAKDYRKTAKVIELAERKSSTVIFIITPCHGCNSDNLRWGCADDFNIDSYERIAQATFGQVFRLSSNDEVTQLLKFVKSVSGGRMTPLVTEYWTSDTWHNVTFQVEKNTEYVEISVSGINVKVENVNRLPGKTEAITNIENAKIWRVTKLKEGQYSIMVQGHGVTTVRVMARSDLTFQHGFIASGANFNTVVKQPTIDKEYRLLIHVDEDDSIKINSVDILDMNWDVIQSLPLFHVSRNRIIQRHLFITDPIMSPTHKFLIQVNGRGRYSNEATRTTSSPITPLIPYQTLTVTIEGQNTYEFYDKVSLKCKVKGYPEPKITWKDGRGKYIKSQTISTPYEYTSTPLYHNVKNETLYCEAANAVDSATAQTDITIKPTFNFTKPLHSSVYFEYLQPAQLECGIESKYPMNILWYAEGMKSKRLNRRFEISNTSRLWISADRKTLHFNKVTEKDIAPTYVCQATLKDNPLYSAQTETEINLKNTGPEIRLSKNILEVIEGEPFSLKALALKGYPPPTYKWYFKERNEYKYVGDGNVYGESAASLIYNSGTYKCVATNTIDEDTKEVQVVVKAYPKIKLTTNVANNNKVPYNSLATLSCKVISHHKPVIRWRNSKGEVVNGETINAETPFTYTSNLDVSTTNDFETYYCEATNKLGKNEKSIDIKVENPIKSIGSGEVDVGYGQEAKLQCGIKSLFPLHITWFKEVNGTYEAIKPSNESIMSFDGHDLKIRKIDIDLQGSYKCKGTLKMDENLKADYNVVVRINDLAAPKIEDIKQDYRLKEKSNVVINCKVREGNPSPNLRWQFKGRTSAHFVDMTDVSIINIENITLDQAGAYKCIAENIVGADQKVFNIAVNALTVTIEGQNTYEFNDKVSLKCKVKSYPEPKITWKDGRGKYIKSQMISTPYEYTSTPLYHNVKNETLYCEAANAVDSATAQTDITIKPTFNFTKPQHSSVYFEYLQPAQLECGIESKYPMNIIWYAEGMESKILIRRFEISNTSRLWISADRKTLHFNKVTEKDIAPTYVCQATLKDNPLYSAQTETEINLKNTGPEIRLSKNILEVIEGEPFSLKALALKGYPPPTYKWYFKERNEYKYVGDGNVYDESAASLIYNSGTYKCVATNTIDEDTKEVQVVVKAYPKIKLTTNVANNNKVPYNSLATLSCEVISHHKPVIRWRNSKGDVVNGETINAETPFTYTSNLDVSTTNDFETYYCEVTNELGKIEKSIDIKVENPIKSIGSGEVDVGYGQEAKLQCGIKSLFPLHITWFKEVNGTYEAIKPSNESIMSFDGHDLKIRKIDIDLQGSYICKGTLKMDENLKADYNVVVRINDLAAPKIEDIKQDYRLKEESNIVINCKVREGNPSPKLRWQFKGRTSTHFVDMTDVSIIKIENITLDQAGTYKCIAENIVGADQKVFNIAVNAPPRIVSDNEIEYMGVAGDSATEVPCKVLGYPEPVITWENRGRQISTNDKFMIYQDYLLIMKPEVNDSSSYTCRADNAYGSDQKTFTVSISGDFMIDLNTNMEYARTGETVNFVCPSEEGDTIQWIKEREPLHYTGSVYTIKNVSTIHDGNYTCRAFNGVTGDRYTTFALDVGYAPSFKHQTVNHEYDWAIKSVVQLDCDVLAKPEADVTWILNGKEIKDSAYVLEGEFLKFNWGNYTCRVSNPHGTIERNFHVTSSNCMIRRSLKIGNMPLLVGNKTNNDDSLTIRHGENILLSCNNQPSTLKGGDDDTTDYIIATCDMQDQYIVKDKTYNYRELQCSSPVKPNIVATSNDGKFEIIKVGFEAINITIYEVYFAKNTNLPLYAKTVVTTDNSHNVELDDWLTYSKFGKDNRKYECIANSTCCLIKGQLVNGQEVMYGPAHTATFIDNLNSVPIWDSCEDDALTWSEYEENVRNQISPRIIPRYTTWTGTHQYEDGVPRFLWKVVRFEMQSSDYPLVAVVKVNSPTPQPDDQLCSTPCPEIFWSTLHGSLYCCVIDEFVKVFNIPDNLFN